ncbi:MAG: DNA repair exonuclease, partial [Deltaproteobacteria bacterium]|nr:DNA repair exonuclease [Deltaproteobacteria bacterium]
EELRNATRRAFENLVDLALQEEVDFLVIAGDLYDSDWKDYNTGLYLLSQLGKLREAKIPVLVVTGNHDALSKITRKLRIPGGITLFPSNKASTMVLEDLGVAVHGRSFGTSVMKKNLAVTYRDRLPGFFNLGILHTSLNGREGHETYAPCSLDDLLSKGYDYWALGHAHRREIVHPQDPVVAFSGNTQGRHVRETGPKGCLLVSVDDAGNPTLEFKSLDVVRWEKVRVDATDLDSGHGVVERVTENLAAFMENHGGLPLIARVEVHGRTRAHAELAGDMDRWVNEVRSAAIDACHGNACVEKVLFLTTDPPREHHGVLEEGPIGELHQYLDEMESDPEQLLSLGSHLDELMKKLPRELKETGESIRPDDPAWIAGVVRGIRPMLIQRLLKKEDSSK